MTKYEKPCEHINKLWDYCKENQVEFYGCDCSGFVECGICKIQVSNSGGCEL